MNSQMILCLTSLIGFVPAMAILYYSLKTYEAFIKDTPLLGFFAGGIIIGLVVFLLHGWIDVQVLNHIDLSILVFIVAFACFEEFIKFIILYYKKFVGDHQTTYLGLSLGLGFGATAVLTFAYVDFLSNPSVVTEMPLVLPTATALSLGYIGLHATTGGLMGFGSAKKIKWYYLGVSVGVHMLFNTIVLAFWWSSSFTARFGLSIFLAAMGMYGVYYFNREIMPASLPKKLARKRRRILRAMKRGWGQEKGGKVIWREKDKAGRKEVSSDE